MKSKRLSKMPGNHRPVAAVATMRFPSWDISVVPMRARLCSLWGEGEIGGLSWPQNISLDDVAEPIAAVVPWLERWHKRGAAIASACSGAGLGRSHANGSMASGPPLIGRWPSGFAISIRR